MRNVYIKTLFNLSGKNRNIMALVADNGAIVYDEYRAKLPGQFVNFGISEANMVSVAAGLASCGKIPFTYTIASFLTIRALDQIRNDVCLQNMNVKLVGIGAGLVYSTLGPTHHATKDITFMRAMPNMTVFSPADSLETEKMTIAAAKIKGPVYLRLATGITPDVYKSDYNFKPGKAVVLKEGKDVAIVSTGCILLEVLNAARDLERLGISTKVVNMHTIKPIDKEIIQKCARDVKAVITVEEHTILGGLGSAVAEVICECKTRPTKFVRLGLKGVFAEGYGSYEEMKEMNGLSKKDIVKTVKKILE